MSIIFFDFIASLNSFLFGERLASNSYLIFTLLSISNDGLSYSLYTDIISTSYFSTNILLKDAIDFSTPPYPRCRASIVIFFTLPPISFNF